MSQNTETAEFVVAILRSARLSEDKTSLAVPAEQLRAGASLRLKTDTKTVFNIGVDRPVAPSNFQVQLGFSVVLSNEEDSTTFIVHESKWTAIFGVLSASPEIKWLDPQSSAFAPYFSFVHYCARTRAEEAIHAAGLHGPALPIPEQFNSKIGEPIGTSE